MVSADKVLEILTENLGKKLSEEDVACELFPELVDADDIPPGVLSHIYDAVAKLRQQGYKIAWCTIVDEDLCVEYFKMETTDKQIIDVRDESFGGWNDDGSPIIRAIH